MEACADTNRDNQRNGVEPFDTATKLWERITFASTLVMAPEAGLKTLVGTNVCFGTTARDSDGNFPAQRPVVFSVTGDNPLPADPEPMAVDGSASFCYAGSNPGTDTIHAFVDNDEDGDAGRQ